MARYTKYGCTGIGRCSFEVKDNNILSGAHTGMDSTCGGGPGVILDETADTVVFKCPVAVPLATAKVLSECEQLQKTNVDYKAGIAATKQEINNLQTQIASVR